MSDSELVEVIILAEELEFIQEIVALIICSIFLVLYIVAFTKLRSLTKKTKSTRPAPIIIVLPILYVSIYTVRYWIELVTKQWDIDDLYAETILDVCFIIGNGIFYCIMMLRLKLGFECTKYKLTRGKLATFVFLLSTMLTINTVFYLIKNNGIDDSSLLNDRNLATWNNDNVQNTFFILLVCNNVILATFLVYLFVKNVVLLIKEQHKRVEHHDFPVISSDAGHTLTEGQLHLLSIAVKYALLCSIAIVVTNVQFGGWILYSFGVFEGNPVDGIYYSIVNEWLWNMVLIVNFSCILLTFSKVTKKVYDALCVCCHRCCINNIERLMVRFVLHQPIDKDSTDEGEKEEDKL